MSLRTEVKQLLRDTIIQLNIFSDKKEMTKAAEWIITNFDLHPDWSLETWVGHYNVKFGDGSITAKNPRYLAIPRVDNAPDVNVFSPGDPRIHCFYQFLPYTDESQKEYKTGKPYSPSSQIIHLTF